MSQRYGQSGKQVVTYTARHERRYPLCSSNTLYSGCKAFPSLDEFNPKPKINWMSNFNFNDKWPVVFNVHCPKTEMRTCVSNEHIVNVQYSCFDFMEKQNYYRGCVVSFVYLVFCGIATNRSWSQPQFYYVCVRCAIQKALKKLHTRIRIFRLSKVLYKRLILKMMHYLFK